MGAQGSHTQQLPVELLSAIFDSTPLSLTPAESPFAAVSPMFALAGVCSLWRNITISTPELWARIRVGLPTDSSAEDGMVAVMWGAVKLCVDRSGDCPLALTLDDRLRPSRIVPGLREAGARLNRVVEVTARVPAVNGILSASLPGGISELSTLKRLFVSASPSCETGGNTGGFRLPAIERFELSMRISSGPLPIYLPWGDLTELNITVTHDYFVTTLTQWWALRLMKKLRNIRLIAPFSSPPVDLMPSPLAHCEIPTLRSLSILAPHSTTWCTLRQLELPSLNRLSLSGLPEEHDPGRDAGLVHHFLARHPLLESLSTHRINLELALKLIEVCRPTMAFLSHSFSGNYDMTVRACQFVQDFLEGKDTVSHVRELTLRDVSRRLPIGKGLFSKEVIDTLVRWASASGEARGGTTMSKVIEVHSVLPLARDTISPSSAVNMLATKGVTLRVFPG